jgi:hypothetical protein
MRHDYIIPMVLVFANISVSTGAAFADEKLKGTYAVSGIASCLMAPSGFETDSKGNPTIARGDDSSVTTNNLQARLIFNGDGTGTISGTWMNVHPPLTAKASVGAGTYSYSFTHTPVTNNSTVILPTPGTNKGTAEYGPAAGRQFAIEGNSYHRVLQLSNDQKSGTIGTSKPEVERLTYMRDSETITVSRVCFVAGSVVRLD